MPITINEIYRSLQGESTWAGLPCTFIRTTACDIRCSWCDTTYSYYEGKAMSLDEVMAEVERLGCDLVELTGGEPLLQKELPELARRLLAKGATVLCETGGHRDISVLPAGVIRIMDIKCPASGESGKNLWSNVAHLNSHDEVKCVVADKADFDWAVERIREHGIEGRVRTILFSPVHGQCDPKALAGWVLESGLENSRMQLQLHKYVWGADATGV